ncbi:MAG: T9SS type A sorting domain-containing protein [Bacteroidia bacterium]
MNDLFNEDPNTLMAAGQVKNLSQFYYLMSDGKFKLTAKVYPQQVPVDYVAAGDTVYDTLYHPITGLPYDTLMLTNDTDGKARAAYMNARAIEWIATHDPTFDWGAFDQRANGPDFAYDNSTSPTPDSVIDYIVFMHREGGSVTGLSGAVFNTPVLKIPGTNYKIVSNYGHFGSRCTPSVENNYDYFTHEFAHSLYSCPHYMGANAYVVGNKLNQYYGWGMMSRLWPVFFTANAWERWYLGWSKPDSVYTNRQVLLYDFSATDTNLTRAIQIPIPNSGGQMLWIENHQKTGVWDYKPFYNTSPQPDVAPGIYMYTTYSGMNNHTTPGGLHDANWANGMMVYHAGGNYDMYPTNDPCATVFGATGCFPLFDTDSMLARPNPFSGSHFLQSITGDWDGDDSIRISVVTNSGGIELNEREVVWREKNSGIATATYAHTGDTRMAFDVGDKIGLSGIVPVKNFPKYSTSTQKNEPFQLNGIQVEVVSYNSTTGAYLLDIKFDKYEINEDKRWCGEFILPSLSGDTLLVAKGKNLLLDLSGTPDRLYINPVTQTLVNPSSLSLQPGALMKLDSGATMTVQNHSSFTLEGSNAKLFLGKNATLHIRDHSLMELKTNSVVILEEGAKIIVDSTASLIMRKPSYLDVKNHGEVIIKTGGSFRFEGNSDLRLLGDNSCLNIQGNWTLAESAIFNMVYGLNFKGFIRLGMNQATGLMAGNVFLEDTLCVINLQGNGNSDLILQIDEGTEFFPELGVFNFGMRKGKIEMGENARIVIPPLPANKTLYLTDLNIVSKTPPDKHKGIFILGPRQHVIENVNVSDGNPGITSWQALISGGERLKIRNSVFTDNTLAIYTIRGNAILEDVTMDENDTGWKADVTHLPGEILNGYFQDGSAIGIRHFGVGDLMVDSSFVSGNEQGIYMNGNSTLRLRCGSVGHNTENGFHLLNDANLDLSGGATGTDYTWVNAANNEYTIRLNRAGIVRVARGYNNFAPTPGTTTKRTLNGSQRLSITSVYSEKNRWNNASTNGTTPVYGSDYQVTNINNDPILYIDPDPEKLYCGTIPCPTCESYTDDPLYNCEDCEEINLTVEPAFGPDGYSVTVSLDEAIRDAMQEMRVYNGEGSDLEAAWRFLQILNFEYEEINVEEQYLLDLAYQNLKRAFASACANNEVLMAAGTQVVFDDLSAEIEDYMSSFLQGDPTPEDQMRYQKDRGTFYFTLGYRTQALSDFNDLLEIATGDDLAHIEEWECKLSAEKALYDETVSIAEFLNQMQQCENGGTQSRKANPALAQTEAPKLQPEPEIALYPNPVTDQIRIDFSLPEAGIAQIEIRDLQGRKVADILHPKLISEGNYSLTYNVRHLSSGVYVVHYFTAKHSKVIKMVVYR